MPLTIIFAAFAAAGADQICARAGEADRGRDPDRSAASSAGRGTCRGNLQSAQCFLISSSFSTLSVTSSPPAEAIWSGRMIWSAANRPAVSSLDDSLRASGDRAAISGRLLSAKRVGQGTGDHAIRGCRLVGAVNIHGLDARDRWRFRKT